LAKQHQALHQHLQHICRHNTVRPILLREVEELYQVRQHGAGHLPSSFSRCLDGFSAANHSVGSIPSLSYSQST